MLSQVTLTLTVPPGVYCIVPSRAEARGEREFLLQVWVDNMWRCDMEEGDQVKVRDYQVKDSSDSLLPFYSSIFLVLLRVLSLWGQYMWMLLVYVQKMQSLLL